MSSKAIAIIEDDSDLCNLFAEALRMNGFGKISAFIEPLKALHHIQQNPNDYSLIISDFRMPGMNGHEL
jgi:DNA-binding NtrC family response regulator